MTIGRIIAAVLGYGLAAFFFYGLCVQIGCIRAAVRGDDAARVKREVGGAVFAIVMCMLIALFTSYATGI